MELNNENYYSQEANKLYFSVSQYHNFIGVPAFDGCEAKAMAILNGEWEEEPSVAMLVGSYVDAFFEGSLDEFKKQRPEIFTLKGELKAQFKQAEDIIEFAKEDELFMSYVVGEGQPQVIVTGNIGGSLWKGKIDRLHKGLAIVDLKVVASIRDRIWCNFEKQKLNFIEAYGYIDQGAVYRELYRQMSGETLPFFIAAITKEKVPDHEIIQIPDVVLNSALERITEQTQRIVNAKTGKMPLLWCGKCDYCRSKKRLTEPILISDLDVYN